MCNRFFRAGIAAIAVAIAIAIVFAPSAAAQDFPARPLRLIVASGAGGGTDLAGRNVAKTLSDSLRVPAFVENRPEIGRAHV